jgi:hypothetical protein
VALVLIQEQQKGNILPALIWLRFCRLAISLMSCSTLLAIFQCWSGGSIAFQPIAQRVGWIAVQYI